MSYDFEVGCVCGCGVVNVVKRPRAMDEGAC